MGMVLIIAMQTSVAVITIIFDGRADGGAAQTIVYFARLLLTVVWS